MFPCIRCGIPTPRLRVDQRHCPSCDRQVQALIAADEARRTPRFGASKDLTGRVAA